MKDRLPEIEIVYMVYKKSGHSIPRGQLYPLLNVKAQVSRAFRCADI